MSVSFLEIMITSFSKPLLFDRVTKMFFKTSQTYIFDDFSEIICAHSPWGLGHALISSKLFTIHSKIDHCTLGKCGGSGGHANETVFFDLYRSGK